MPNTVGFPVPTRADQWDFLLRVYLGPDADDLAACVHRAYLDLSRTLHGFSRLPRRIELSRRAHEHVRRALETPGRVKETPSRQHASGAAARRE
ncbi:MAG: hypothetical protein ABSA52_23605 [Candidatus Binatia bacterium]